ncbi:collagen-like protein, partial [Arenibacter sp. GZD96]|nr:collagen-like protein [Arenibacter sp. GZD-96]
MNKRILLVLFLISGMAFAQTTITLEDQCNCEVLSGTAVTVPGVNTPAGADLGDLYVNTTTGTIFFWDGNSWEFSSTGGTSIISTIDNGNGTFTFNYADGSSFTTSNLTGPQGLPGADGANGADGADGNGIASTSDNGDGTFTLTFDDGSTFTTSDLTGPQGAQGIQGLPGADGADGANGA